jgi:flagellar FliL protein
MSAATTTTGGAQNSAPVRKSGKKKLLLLLAVPVLLVVAGAGAWFAGVLPAIPGMKHEPAAMAAVAPVQTYVELPEIVANLNAGARRSSFVKLKARLELAQPEDLVAFTAAQPRVLDLFQTYLRETRPDELRGSMGTYRLREQLIARANLVVAPARVVDVLFTELLVQ